MRKKLSRTYFSFKKYSTCCIFASHTFDDDDDVVREDAEKM